MLMLKSTNARMNVAPDPWLTSMAVNIIPGIDLCIKRHVQLTVSNIIVLSSHPPCYIYGGSASVPFILVL
jgi:hypothetical protein